MGRTATIVRASILIAALLAAACGGGPTSPEQSGDAGAEAALQVHVVNYPLRYFAERVGGAVVHVEFPAPAGSDPAFWAPDVSDVAAYQAADLILLNGAGYARWIRRVSLPASKLVDTSAGFHDRLIETSEAVTHAHGPEGEHVHGEFAFSTWLDPTLAVEQARAVLEAFVAARPQHESSFRQGFAELESDLLALDEWLRELTTEDSDLPLLGSHPVYQYLARRYALDLRSVHFEPDEVPDDAAWRGLETLLADHPAHWMLWEAAPLQQSADRLREAGVESVVFDPCGNVPDEGDYLDVMRRNATNLEAVF